MSSLVERIKMECNQRGMSIPDMEVQIGLTPKGIYRWDLSSPSVNKVKAVADFLGVSIDSLVERDGYEEDLRLPYEVSLLLSGLNREGIDIIKAVAKGLSIQERYQLR